VRRSVRLRCSWQSSESDNENDLRIFFSLNLVNKIQRRPLCRLLDTYDHQALNILRRYLKTSRVTGGLLAITSFHKLSQHSPSSWIDLMATQPILFLQLSTDHHATPYPYPTQFVTPREMISRQRQSCVSLGGRPICIGPRRAGQSWGSYSSGAC